MTCRLVLQNNWFIVRSAGGLQLDALFFCASEMAGQRLSAGKDTSGPARKSLSLGSKKLIQEPLVDRAKMLIPLLLMKLGIMTHFLQALDKMEIVLTLCLP